MTSLNCKVFQGFYCVDAKDLFYFIFQFVDLFPAFICADIAENLVNNLKFVSSSSPSRHGTNSTLANSSSSGGASTNCLVL